MSIDEQELRAVHFLAQRIRRSTPGAGPWDDDGLMKNMRKLQHWNLHLFIEHVLRHAADPKAKTPGVLLGSFTPGAPEPEKRYPAPKKPDECRKHPGQYADNCATCITEPQRAYNDPEEPVEPMATEDARKLARAESAKPMRTTAVTPAVDRKEA